METGTSTSPIKRRLTAILAADAVGYSRQMSENEERTLKALAAQRAIIDRIIVAHGGRIVSTAGDSVLAEFSSSVEAVRCAVEIQEGLETRNASLPETERLVFRIGVNLGDVMVDGADILGDGVNVAARLEGIAEPGGICISSSVYDQIAGKLNLGFVDIGEKSLKNISRPIRVYRFDRSGELAAMPRRSASPSRTLWIGIGAVAVLAIAAVGIWRSGSFEQRAAAPPAPHRRARSRRRRRRTGDRAGRNGTAARGCVRGDQAQAADRRSGARQGGGGSRPIASGRRGGEAARARRAQGIRVATGRRTGAGRLAVEPARRRRAPRLLPPRRHRSAPPIGAAAERAAVHAPQRAHSQCAAARAHAGASPAAHRHGQRDRNAICDAWEELKPFNDTLPARVADGEIVVERGEPGQLGYTRMSGGRRRMAGCRCSDRSSRRCRALNGKEFPMRFEGTYSNGQYTLNGRMGTRTCTVIVRVGRASVTQDST